MSSKATIQSQFTRRPWVAAAVAAAAALASTPVAAQQTAASPYDKWLAEDAAYIISAQERAAYTRLSTDAERRQFIEQFWLIRDPSPGTPENEMKVEHYRRIAYANARYGGQSVQGWRSARGRLYILFGPPDEIESHPQDQYEAWRYRSGPLADVVLRFDLRDPKQ
jgi:GWxTD domain-containing protein